MSEQRSLEKLQRWVQEVINHRGKTNRSEECTLGYYNFEGAENRRQDGNYNGGFRRYFQHQNEVRLQMEKHFHLRKDGLNSPSG